MLYGRILIYNILQKPPTYWTNHVNSGEWDAFTKCAYLLHNDWINEA